MKKALIIFCLTAFPVFAQQPDKYFVRVNADGKQLASYTERPQVQIPEVFDIEVTQQEHAGGWANVPQAKRGQYIAAAKRIRGKANKDIRFDYLLEKLNELRVLMSLPPLTEQDFEDYVESREQ